MPVSSQNAALHLNEQMTQTTVTLAHRCLPPADAVNAIHIGQGFPTWGTRTPRGTNQDI